MRTTSIAVQTLCIPCHNRCRYCLLSWDGKLPGADYARSEAYARRFHQWIQENRPDLSFQFYFGYSMEHPQLADAIDFMGSIGSAGGQFLQLDGLAFRDEAGIREYLSCAKAHGIRSINLTFYGLRDYHDRFAGRRGDFDYLMSILRNALSLKLEVSVGIPLTRESAPQAEALLRLLLSSGVSPRFFIPHAEGRGISLNPIRLRLRDLAELPEQVRDRLNHRMFRAEHQWLREGSLPLPEKRALTLSLTPENIGHFEELPFDQTIRYLESLDDAWYNALPALPELLEMYAEPGSDALYSFRDLCMHCARKYFLDHPAQVHDITDERQSFSRRY